MLDAAGCDVLRFLDTANHKAKDGNSGATHVNKYGCVVIETEDWIDGINNPQWGRDQIFGPDDGPVVNFATYQFGTF